MIRFGRPVTIEIEPRLPRVIDALARDPQVDPVWLFGSRARGEADALSDVDVAVLAATGIERSALWDKQLEWIGGAVQALGTDEVSLEVLNRLPVALRYSILRDARLGTHA